MQKIELIAPCHFGLESVLKREIYDLGYDTTRVEDGRVFFEGDAEAVCRANIHLRTPQRILINAGEFFADSFEALFEGVRAIPWEQYLPDDANCQVAKATSVKSKLFSTRDIQAIVKKAVVERMKQKRGMTWLPETGDLYPLRVFLYKDMVTVGLDTSGESLHRRGYRLQTGKAPIEETLAAALIGLTPWRPGRILADPFCGSGTFLIEAAMMAANIAPGAGRTFASCKWTHLIPEQIWEEVRDEAREAEDRTAETDLQGFDINGKLIAVAKENAKRAGVEKMIHFQKRPVSAFRHSGKFGFLITNPPYGERLNPETTRSGKKDENMSLAQIYRDLGAAMENLPTWSAYLITSYDQAERMIGKRAQKKRKIYNGMLRTDYYMFPGPKPPR